MADKFQKTTILFTRFPYSSSLGGEELHTVDIARNFAQKGFDICLFTSDKILRNLFASENFSYTDFGGNKWFLKPPVTVTQLFIFTLLSPLWSILFFVKIMRFFFAFRNAQRVVYMLSFTEKLLCTIPARMFGCKVIWLEHARIGNWWRLNPWRAVYTLLSFFVTVIVPSYQTAKPLRFVRNVRVIPHGIDVESQKNDSKDSDEPYFLCIARLSVDKGVDVLVEAYERLLNELKKSTIHGENHRNKPKNMLPKLKIIGTGREEAKIRMLINQKNLTNQIELLGKLERKNVIHKVACSYAIILPSISHDPFGLVCLEAMSLGKPVIVSDVCGIVDFLEKDEALMVKAGDVEDLCASMMNLFLDKALYDKVAKAGLDVMQTKFSRDQMMKQYQLLLK